MDIEDILNYTISRDICVSISIVPEYYAWLRHIRFLPGNTLMVEFYPYGSDLWEGYRFQWIFDDINIAVKAVEEYLQRQIYEWINYTKTGFMPECVVSDVWLLKGHMRLLHDIYYGCVKLPEGTFTYQSIPIIQEEFQQSFSSMQRTLRSLETELI